MTISRTGIDRIAPALRPPGRSVMRHRWADLLFLHWLVPIEALRPLIPAELEVDAFEGTAYVGLVPFTMTGVRPWWAPSVPGLSNFHEVNVRTYVHFQGRDPGVWFLSLDAAQAIAVRIARRFWQLPYHFARMSLERRAGGSIGYASDRLWPGPTPASVRVTYRPEGSPRASVPGTIEHFLAERYILYAGRTGALWAGRVHHAPYPLQQARVEHLEDSLVAAAGLPSLDAPPLAHYASEVRVRVYPLARLSRRCETEPLREAQQTA